MNGLQVIYDPLKQDTRCPLIYPLLGLLCGIPIGTELSHCSPLPWAIAATTCSLITAIHTLRSQRQSIATGALLLLSGLIWSIGFTIQRTPPPPESEPMPPREATLQIRVDRLFNSQRPNRISGIGTVQEAPFFATECVGRTIFFSARIGPSDALATLPSATLEITGVWRQTAVSGDGGFEQFLLRQRTFWMLSRGRVEAVTAPPKSWRRGASTLCSRMQRTLEMGAGDEYAEAARVLQAMMLGRKDLLGEDLRNDLTLAGTMHLFAVSGLHIGIIAKTIGDSLRRFMLAPMVSQVLTVVIVAIFVAAIGLPPSAVRAGLLILCLTSATLLRRHNAGTSALAAAAILVLLWSPDQIRHPGFQLSYSVVCGIFLYSLPLRRLLRLRLNIDQTYPFPSIRLKARKWIFSTLINLSAISIGAGVSSAPLIAGFFGTCSIGSVPLNMIIVPLASGVVVLGTVSIATGFIGALAPITELINELAYLGILFINNMISDIIKIPLLFYSGPAPNDTAIAAIQIIYLLSLLILTPTLNRCYSLIPFALPPAFVVASLALVSLLSR